MADLLEAHQGTCYSGRPNISARLIGMLGRRVLMAVAHLTLLDAFDI